jgi:hypothetical protein
VYKRLHDEDEVAAVVSRNCGGDGVYGLPAAPLYASGMDNAAREAIDHAVHAKLVAGPLLTIVFQRSGYSTIVPKLFRAVVTGMICGFVFTILLLLVQSRGRFEVTDRVAVVALGSLAALVATRLPDWNWHGYSPAFVAVQIADTLIGCTIVGAIVAAITLHIR